MAKMEATLRTQSDTQIVAQFVMSHSGGCGAETTNTHLFRQEMLRRMHAHDDLVKALSLLVRTIGDCKRHGFHGPMGSGKALIECLPQARAALAKAEPK